MKILKEINIEKLHFELPEKDEDGYYISNCRYEEEEMYWLLKNVKLSTSLCDEDELIIKEEENKELFEMMSKIDEKIVHIIQERSEEWFGKRLKKQIIQRNFKTLLKENFVDSAFISIPLDRDDEQELTFEIYNENKEQIDETELEVPCESHILLKLNGLRFTRSKVEALWDIVQMKVLPRKKVKKIEKKCLIDDEEI